MILHPLKSGNGRLSAFRGRPQQDRGYSYGITQVFDCERIPRTNGWRDAQACWPCPAIEGMEPSSRNVAFRMAREANEGVEWEAVDSNCGKWSMT